LIAVVTAVAVAWTTLAPLAATMRDAPVEPLCHQAGMQVDAASSPLPAQPGEAPPRKTHCPLCIMVFFAAFAPLAAVPPHHANAIAHRAGMSAPQLARLLRVALPQSHAPPDLPTA
jgi:hypothetical protein